LNYAPV